MNTSCRSTSTSDFRLSQTRETEAQQLSSPSSPPTSIPTPFSPVLIVISFRGECLVLLPKKRRSHLGSSDGVDVDVPVGGTGEQGVSVRRPLQGHAPRDSGLRDGLGGELVQDVLVLQVPDLDGSIGGGAQPVVLRGEAHGVDGGVVLQRVQVLSIIDIPQHGGSVLTTGTTKRTIRRDGDGVQDTSVSGQVGLQLAVVEVPDLDELVPTTGDDQRVLGGRRESDAGDPIGVVLLGDGVLALSQGVPQLDGLIAGTGDDLTVVGGKSDGVDVLGVTLELTDGLSSVQIPQAHGAVHGTGKSELTIGRDDGIANGLIVAVQAATSVTRGVGIIRSEFPHNGGLVTGTGHNQVGLLVSGSDGSNPSGVALEGTSVRDLSHLDAF